jgi:hypothetical protein
MRNPAFKIKNLKLGSVPGFRRDFDFIFLFKSKVS